MQFAAYADDLVVVISGNSRKAIETEGQRAVDLITEWSKFAKLQISERKTEAILLKNDAIPQKPIGRRGGDRPDRKRKRKTKTVNFDNRPPRIKLNDANIKFKRTVKYLGINFDRGLKVKTHCAKLSSSTKALFNKLGRLARTQWGLKYAMISMIYRGVFVPKVTYAAAGWSDLCTKRDIRVLRAAQRKALISVTNAYRTASFESLCVVAGATPVDILLKKYATRYHARKERVASIGNVEIPAGTERKVALRKIQDEATNMWQTEWNSSNKGRTTFAFFDDVWHRIAARTFFTDHWVTQVLTGHGNFRLRLASFGLVDGGSCTCGDREDTVQHFLLECLHFEAQRVVLRDMVPVGEWRWPEVARFFVSGPEAFAVFADFCRITLWLKGCETREPV